MALSSHMGRPAQAKPTLFLEIRLKADRDSSSDALTPSLLNSSHSGEAKSREN